MKRLFLLSSLMVLSISCGSGSSPSSSSGSNSSGFSWNGPIILTTIESGIVFAEIATQTGPTTNATITLTSANSPAVLTYQTSGSYPVTANGSVTILNLAYYTNSSFTYAANQPYTITAVFGGNTYQATTTTVGTPVFSTSGSNVVCTWTGGGNANIITASESISPYTTKVFGPSVSSPYSIPTSTLPGPTGDNDILANVINLNSSAFTGTSNGSYFAAISQALGVY